MAKGRQNYFDQMIRQYGEDFLLFQSPSNIQNSAKRRIFREMVKGEIDYTTCGKYYQDSKFVENLLIAASDELQNNNIILSALTEFNNSHPGINKAITLGGEYWGKVQVYTVLYNSLYAMKLDNYNIGHLSDISALLYQYRNIL